MDSELFSLPKKRDIITSTQFIDFLNSFQRPVVCQICGAQEWSVSVTYELEIDEGKPKHIVIETVGYAQFIVEEDRAVNYPGGLPVIRMTCACCGHILLFSYKIARDRILAAAKESEDS